MTLRAPGRSPERLLIFGIEGTGKTRGFLSIARATPNVTHWIVDNDNGVDRLLETEFSDLKVKEEYYMRDGVMVEDDQFTDPEGTIVLIHAQGWENNAAAISHVVENATRSDWWLIDNASNIWRDVQAWYVEKVHGLDMDDFLIDYRIAKKKEDENKKGQANEAMFIEWTFLNPVYQKAVQRHLIQPPCHLYVAAMQTDLNPRDTDKTTADIYGSVHVKAQGQKSLGANAQTVLWIKKMAKGEWHYKTLKDRGRDQLTGYAVDDFANDYLMEVAGWVTEATSRETTGPSTANGSSKKKVVKKVAKSSG